ncbi:MAG: tRNA lysidine(34) synthetase TilS [Phycisphaerales bacterium]|nr:MAG: tRNA lysidine(34) synthetase TilS [Phycisphaerales bacterium]
MKGVALVEFEQKTACFGRANELFGPASRILLAVSGGADSIALLHVMQALKAESNLAAKLCCAHINHQLRGTEANSDESFVTKQAAKLNLPIRTRRVDVQAYAAENKLSIETAARELRIRNLLEIARANNCNLIVTGHHKNDNAETVLQRLIRGTGFRGLSGIRPSRDLSDGLKFVRPLLCVTRKEILQYLRSQKLQWREDRTNADCTHRRNFIRHRLLPALQRDCKDSIVELLSQLAESAGKFHCLIAGRAERVWPELADCGEEEVTLDLKLFLSQPRPVQVELVRLSLAAIGSGERNLTQLHYERILQLAERDIGGRKIELPGRFAVLRDYGKLVFVHNRKDSRSPAQIERSVALDIPGKARFGPYLIEATVFEARKEDIERFETNPRTRRDKTAVETGFLEQFDLDKIKVPLAVRFREPGDRFWPIGLAGEKKVGKFLTSARAPLAVRKQVVIVVDGEKIIWACPLRMSELAKVTRETRRILQLRIVDARP